MVLMGGLKMAVAVTLGPTLLSALDCFPRSVLGVLLAVGGIELAMHCRGDNFSRHGTVVVLIGAGITLSLGTGAAFVGSFVAAWVFSFRGRSLMGE